MVYNIVAGEKNEKKEVLDMNKTVVYLTVTILMMLSFCAFVLMLVMNSSTLSVKCLFSAVNGANAVATQQQIFTEATSAGAFAGQQNGSVHIDTLQGTDAGSFDVMFAAGLFELTNEERQTNGLEALIWDETLVKIAQVRAQEASVCFSHNRPDGSICWTVCPERYKGENLSKGYKTPEEAMQGWMASETHRSNILSQTYRYIGIATFLTEDGCQFTAQSFAY